MTFPSGLQSLTFGAAFNQNLEDVTFPNGLTLGAAFDQNLEGVTLPSSLQSLMFTFAFDQNLKGAPPFHPVCKA